ncbi:MAG TPA: TetR/AcrR family transcriptional regulator [Microbacterium sp.]|nr:TetR/AcrR family transcriptional regulator [Microbacterium sp.]
MTRQVTYGGGREMLIAATVEVVAEAGLRGFTFRSVAHRAGVSNGLIAHHFGTRHALLVAAMEWAVDNAIESTHLAGVIRGEVSPEEFVGSIADFPEVHAFQSEMILEARRNEAFRAPIRELYERYQRAADGAVRSLGIDDGSASLARRAFAFLDGVVLQSMAGVDRRTLVGAVSDLQRDVRERATAARAASPAAG